MPSGDPGGSRGASAPGLAMLPIYLDHAATTPTDPRVVQAMLPWLSDRFGNASSRHIVGEAARRAVEQARFEVRALAGAPQHRCVFTSGATESLNLAIAGIAAGIGGERGRAEPPHVVVAATEHRAALEPARRLAELGWVVTELRPEPTGWISAAAVRAALRPATRLLVVMAANNETGVLAPVDELGAVAREAGVRFVCDATQRLGWGALGDSSLVPDVIVGSAHKLGGVKGAGFLLVSPETARAMRPLVVGGGQESGLRAGTVAVPLVVALGEAARLACLERHERTERAESLRTRLCSQLVERIRDVRIFGDPVRRLPNIALVGFRGADAEAVLARLYHTVCASAGAACAAATPEPSHVLRAMGFDEEDCFAAVRFSLGATTTADEVDAAFAHIVSAVEGIRAASA